MPNKPGRPPGAKNKIGQDLKAIIEDLAKGMEPIVREKLDRMATKRDPDIDIAYIKTFIELSKFIIPKPVEIDATIDSSDFQSLVTICQQWDDQK